MPILKQNNQITMDPVFQWLMRSGLFGTSRFKRASSSGFVATEPAPHREGAEVSFTDSTSWLKMGHHGSIGMLCGRICWKSWWVCVSGSGSLICCSNRWVREKGACSGMFRSGEVKEMFNHLFTDNLWMIRNVNQANDGSQPLNPDIIRHQLTCLNGSIQIIFGTKWKCILSLRYVQSKLWALSKMAVSLFFLAFLGHIFLFFYMFFPNETTADVWKITRTQSLGQGDPSQNSSGLELLSSSLWVFKRLETLGLIWGTGRGGFWRSCRSLHQSEDLGAWKNMTWKKGHLAIWDRKVNVAQIGLQQALFKASLWICSNVFCCDAHDLAMT